MTGRQEDLLVVQGQNVYVADLEDLIHGHPEVRKGVQSRSTMVPADTWLSRRRHVTVDIPTTSWHASCAPPC